MGERTIRDRVFRSGLIAMVMLCAAMVHGADAADQTEYLKKPPSILADAGNYVDTGTGELTYERARRLVRVVFKDSDTDAPEFYCVIHVLRWGADPSTIDKSRWYIYRGRGSRAGATGRWTPARFTGSRIYGSDTLALLYVHLNVPGKPVVASRADLEKTLTGEAAVEGVKKPTAAELIPETGAPSTDVVSTRQRSLARIDNFIVEQDYTSITYQIDVVKKLPAPIQNLSDAFGLLQANEAERRTVDLNQPVALYAADEFDIYHVPSDITVTGKLTIGNGLASKTTELGKQTYDNEGLYYWDISLGIPLRSTNQLDFQTSGGQVFAKQVDKAQLLALFNIFWRPVDTKNVRYQLTPTPVVGLALSKKPLTKMLIGVSLGLNKVQAFVGRQWSQIENAPAPAASATTPATTTAQHYEQSWIAGINVPVRQVVDFLKAKK